MSIGAYSRPRVLLEGGCVCVLEKSERVQKSNRMEASGALIDWFLIARPSRGTNKSSNVCRD